jgi:hypothetical protein
MRSPRGLKLLSERTELAIISLVVGGLLLVVVASGPLGFRLSNSVATAAILAALVALLRVSAKLYDLDASTGELLQRARSGTNVQRFRTYPEFYEALSSELAGSKRSVRLTHIRNDPPAAFQVDSNYFSDVEVWAKDHPGCSVRRVIAVNNERMHAWAEALRATEESLPNFSVRVTSRSAGLPVINMAILDEKEVFLAISGESPEQTAGVWISDEEVGRYFSDYYDHLWTQSESLKQALSVPSSGTGT